MILVVQYIENEKNPLYTLCDVYGIEQKSKRINIKKYNFNSCLKKKDQLNNVQKIGLKYYDEINEKIPREEIDL